MAAPSLDAVIIGGGHHGLVAATVLADAGWDVCLLEATDRVGGAVLPAHAVPAALREDLERFQWDSPVMKVNWALRGSIPWRAPGARGAGTVHVGADVHQMAHWSADIDNGVIPRAPFLLVGHMTTADASRSPAGTESAWAYTHLPRGISDDASADLLAQRVEEVLERFAPGFSTQVLQRIVQRPGDLERDDANLVHGAVNGGTAQLHQQLMFRPVPGLGRAETPVPGLYLGSAAERIPAAVCTAPADGWRPAPHWPTTAHSAGCAAGSPQPRWSCSTPASGRCTSIHETTHGRGCSSSVARNAASESRTRWACSCWKASIRRASAGSEAARMRTASSPALRAPPTDTVATGTPAGICTMDSSESNPPRCASATGTPITGSTVAEATMPGRCAAPPAPAMITFSPRLAASRA